MLAQDLRRIVSAMSLPLTRIVPVDCGAKNLRRRSTMVDFPARDDPITARSSGSRAQNVSEKFRNTGFAGCLQIIFEIDRLSNSIVWILSSGWPEKTARVSLSSPDVSRRFEHFRPPRRPALRFAVSFVAAISSPRFAIGIRRMKIIPVMPAEDERYDWISRAVSPHRHTHPSRGSARRRSSREAARPG